MGRKLVVPPGFIAARFKGGRDALSDGLVRARIADEDFRQPPAPTRCGSLYHLCEKCLHCVKADISGW